MNRIDAALHEWQSLDTLAARDTPLARFDARAKLLATLAFIVTVVSFDRYRVAALLPLAAYPIVLAALGEVPLRALARKLAVAAPFALVVGLFNPWLDRAPMLAVGAITVSAGWVSFASILLRFGLTVSAALLLVAGTGMHTLCAALGMLGVPRSFTTQLLFLYRYAFVLGGEAARLTTARALRSCAKRTSLASYGALTGQLLLRTIERAQRIHLAMSARGFDGELRSPRALRWAPRDTRFVLGWCVFFTAARAIDLPQWLGGLLTTAFA